MNFNPVGRHLPDFNKLCFALHRTSVKDEFDSFAGLWIAMMQKSLASEVKMASDCEEPVHVQFDDELTRRIAA
jgi:hypothetical protein